MNALFNQPFNQLSDSEAERLAILSEECGEVIQCVGKILRHGYACKNPDNPAAGSNRQQLQKELADLIAQAAFMEVKGDINVEQVLKDAETRVDKIKSGVCHTHHQ